MKLPPVFLDIFSFDPDLDPAFHAKKYHVLCSRLEIISTSYLFIFGMTFGFVKFYILKISRQLRQFSGLR